MRLPSARSAVLIATALILVLFFGLAVWRLSVWNETGMIGMMYHPPLDPEVTKEQREVFQIGAFRQEPGSVAGMAPGLPAEQAGIVIGDRVIAVEGVPIERQTELEQVASRARVGDTLLFKILREGREIEVPVRVTSPLDSPRMMFGLVSNALIGLAFLAISFLVFWQRADSQRARIFYYASTVGALFFFSSVFTELELMGSGIVPNQYQMQRILAVLPIYGLLSVLMINLLLHLALVFPRERPVIVRHPRLPVILHAIPLLPIAGIVIALAAIAVPKPLEIWVFGALAVTAGVIVVILTRRARSFRDALLGSPWLSFLAAILLIAAAIGSVMTLAPRSVGMPVFVLFFLTGVILWPLGVAIVYTFLAAAALYRSYRESGVDEKRQVRWPLWGTILALAGTGLYGIVFFVVFNIDPTLLARNQTVALIGGLFVKLCYLLIPVSFAFGILKYRLMQIDLIIRKTVIYGAVTAIVIVVYLVLVGGIGTAVLRVAAIENQTVVVVATLAIAAVLVPVRNRVQGFVDRRFFRARYDYADSLQKIAERAGSAAPLEETLRFATERIQQALQTRTAALFLKEPGEPFAPVITIGLPDEAREQTRLAWGGEKFPEGERVIEVDALALGDADRAKLQRVDPALLAPISSRGGIAGFISVGPRLAHAPFEDEDREFLASAAALLAPAIEIERARREQHEYQQAREIQRALLPSVVPQPPGFSIAGFSEPARAVGGDYFDVLDLGGGAMALCIADVCGKGMTAALLMSGLQAAVRSLSSPETSPAELASRVRRVVTSNLSGGKFITFFYAVLRPDGRLSFTNAGHNYPILARADGSVERLRDGGPVLGRLFADRQFKQGEVQIHPGDRLVLFTDGVSEARNVLEEEFGEERLAAFVSSSSRQGAEALRKKIVDEITRFTSGNFHDDVTLVIVDRG